MKQVVYYCPRGKKFERFCHSIGSITNSNSKRQTIIAAGVPVLGASLRRCIPISTLVFCFTFSYDVPDDYFDHISVSIRLDRLSNSNVSPFLHTTVSVNSGVGKFLQYKSDVYTIKSRSVPSPFSIKCRDPFYIVAASDESATWGISLFYDSASASRD